MEIHIIQVGQIGLTLFANYNKKEIDTTILGGSRSDPRVWVELPML